MADHVFGTTRVYVRKTLDDSWVDRSSDLFPASRIVRKAGAITGLLLNQRYGKSIPAAKEDDLHKFWVKVTHEPDGGSETIIWYGNIDDSRIVESSEIVQWTAVSIEAQLDRVKPWGGYAVDLGALSEAQFIHRLRFNDGLDTQGEHLEGLRSDEQYHFGSAAFREYYTAPEDTDDICYVFGADSPWTATNIIGSLVTWYAGKGGRPGVCPVAFKPTGTTAALTYLGAYVDSWDFTGKSLLDIINEVVSRAGPLMWWVDVTAFDAGDDDFITLNVVSRLWADKHASQDAHTITTVPADTSPALAGIVHRRVKDRITTVIARGAPLKAMFTIDYNTASTPYYEGGWDPDLATDWLASEDDENALKSKWVDVYTRLIVPYDQTVGGVSSWKIYVRPDPHAYGGESEGDRIFTTTIAGLADAMYLRPRRFLPYNLTYRGFTQPTANDGTFPAALGSDPAQAEHDPTLAWYVPAAIDAQNTVYRVRAIRPLPEQSGLRLSTIYRNLDSPLPFISSLDDEWQKLKITVSCELDRCLEWSESVPEWDDDQCRIEVIYMPQCEWWAARQGTIYDIDADGTETNVYGVLRNDLPALKQAAENRVALLNQRESTTSKRVQPFYFGQLPLKWVDMTYELGDFVETYGSWDFRAPIAEISHETRHKEIYGTTLVTHKSPAIWDMP